LGSRRFLRCRIYIDDVDHILFDQCCLAERLPQQRFALIVERFNFEKLAHSGPLQESLGSVKKAKSAA
jgi:hypothetical protein